MGCANSSSHFQGFFALSTAILQLPNPRFFHVFICSHSFNVPLTKTPNGAVLSIRVYAHLWKGTLDNPPLISRIFKMSDLRIYAHEGRIVCGKYGIETYL